MSLNARSCELGCIKAKLHYTQFSSPTNSFYAFTIKKALVVEKVRHLKGFNIIIIITIINNKSQLVVVKTIYYILKICFLEKLQYVSLSTKIYYCCI